MAIGSIASIRRSTFSLLVLFGSLAIHAQQNTGTISGHITDLRSGEALLGATVYELRSGKGTVSNPYGFYSLTLPADSVVLRFSYVGYQTLELRLKLGGQVTQQVRLEPSLELREVEVAKKEASKSSSLLRNAST